ncbi:LOW QUALITY PROTEIN: hypothetical protein HID58_054796, partial [Brassica napus]
ATAEHLTAKIAVWWDMKDCPIPEGCWSDPTEFRRGVQGKRVLWSCLYHCIWRPNTNPWSHPARALFHWNLCSTYHIRKHMQPHVSEYGGMARSKSSSGYNDDHIKSGGKSILLGSVRPVFSIVLSTSQEWRWKELLQNKRSAPLVVVQGAKLYCKSCNYGSQRLKKFRKHLSSYNHAREEGVTTVYTNVERVTADWGRNYKATPEFATAKIQVWWDMFDCPIPQGYDARQVRPSIEAAFKELGYSGPVSITAYGDHKHTPLQALSSTGVHVAHAVPGVEYKRMAGDVREWHADNPPQTAAIMMVISDNVDIISIGLVKLLQENKYNLFLAYSFRPYQMSYLLTSAEWLWESLLAGPLTKHSLLSESESSNARRCRVAEYDRHHCPDRLKKFRKHLWSKL